MLTCHDVRFSDLQHLLQRFGLRLRLVEPGEDIPGSYWGAPEAGLLGTDVWVRGDTPVHSLLHEAGHSICMDAERRRGLDTDAGGEDMEENGVCYLQVLLSDHIPGVGRQRLMADMDAWGYSFRLGSTQAWFEQDAADAAAWLQQFGIVDAQDQVLWRTRQDPN